VAAFGPSSSMQPVSAVSNNKVVQKPKVRKEFPETWIWAAFEDVGLVFFSLAK
jgi:hypothetical protein